MQGREMQENLTDWREGKAEDFCFNNAQYFRLTSRFRLQFEFRQNQN